MRLQATWIIPGILITLLLGLLWAMPASAADAGDIMFLDGDGNEISFVSTNGPANTDGFTVQIEDQDLNTPTEYTGVKAVPADEVDGAGSPADRDIDWTDLANRTDDDERNYKDFTALDAGVDTLPGTDDDSAVTVARADIVLDITNGTLVWTPSGGATHLEFHLNEKTEMGTFASAAAMAAPSFDQDTVLVTIDSGGGETTSIALEETTSSSGKFTVTVVICDDDCTPSQSGRQVDFPVDPAADTITIRYIDASPRTTRSANISLDTDNPSFSNVSPDSGTAGMDPEPDVSFEVVDGESGIQGGDEPEDATIRIVAALFQADEDPDVQIGDVVTIIRGELDVDDVTDGFSVDTRLREGGTGELNAGDAEEYEIRWWAVAMDMAGNTGVSDSDSDTECTYSGEALDIQFDINGDISNGAAVLIALKAAENVGADNEERCDPNVIRVDGVAPELVAAETGVFYDPDEPSDEGTGSLTSIVARFDEALDCDSVEANDFEVGGAAPNAVTCVGSNVYLSVDELESNDTPTVSVGEESLSDRAGNLIGGDDDDREVESTDDIPAALDVTITGTGEGDRPVTDGSITITVTSDERLRGRPTVSIELVGTDYALGTDMGGTASPTGSTNEWSITKTISGAGLYNVYVTAEDRVSSGESKAGVNTFDEDTIDDGKALLFEVDKDVSAPEFLPEDEGTTDNAGIFIRANFSNEDSEYGLLAEVDICREDAGSGTGSPDVDGDCATGYTKGTTMVATTTAGEAATETDFDTHSMLTLVEATFNDDDVTDDVITRDSVLFVYRPGNLSNGEHTFEIEVEDNAGNEATFSTTFEKIDKAAYELSLNPGPNLVSFPANPENGDINAVFGGEGNEDITSVLTYENATGLWMTANKGADGTFTGDLTTINGMSGYWVVADGVVDVFALLEGSGNFIQPPPHIVVSEGWNLVGVVDASQREAGTPISGYFDNIEAEVVYGYDSLNAALVRQTDESDVTTGSGYWVYANEAGIIIP